MNATDRMPADRVVLISGANRGIGRAIAERLAAAGYRLSLGARDPDTLEPVVAGLEPSRVHFHRYEAREPATARHWLQAAADRFGGVDALVNNSALFHRFTVIDGDLHLLDEMWEVNVKGPLILFQTAFPFLKASGCGRVVNIVSLSGKRLKSATVAGYGMTKHAAAAFTHAVRLSGWEHGIRATAICPGYVNTDMSRNLAQLAPEEMTQPRSVAELVELALRLPNNATVSELPVNCVLEASY
ncbi:MAG: SDR family NAD(P)-dependent oxidoreductase [Gammaproteobacteria bacterium]|nr:SDR family NAD(P)-dependent oxidoreductase [Gammaproteobacteria bacterium]MDJ0892118.1 SDR family NAD(P)-dependent oxidoreductase [Gammaproteobacteria bacterium]